MSCEQLHRIGWNVLKNSWPAKLEGNQTCNLM
jgi:hypothetical protein